MDAPVVARIRYLTIKRIPINPSTAATTLDTTSPLVPITLASHGAEKA